MIQEWSSFVLKVAELERTKTQIAFRTTIS